MQFPKAKRFADRPPDDIPPPGAYDVPVHSPPQPYKRGAMVERASRFADRDPNKPDTFGLYHEDPLAEATADKENVRARTRPAGTAAADRERHKLQLEELRARLDAAHSKELTKLRAKVDKLEEARIEHRKEREELYKESDKLKSENRHLTSKLSRSTAVQQKYEATLPSLQAKLTSLSTQHAASSAKKDAELSALRITLSQVETDLDEARAKTEAWRRTAANEQRGREDAALACGELVASMRAQLREHRVEELAAARLRAVVLERRVQDREAVLASVGDYARGLEARLALAETQREEAEWREWRVREAWRTDRGLLVGGSEAEGAGVDADAGRNEKEWRQRARADARELDGLRDEVKAWEKEEALEREWDQIRGEWERRRDKALREERKRMQRDYEVVEGELDLAVNDEIPRLEALLAASESSLATARDDLATSNSQIAQLEADVTALETQRAEEAERFEGELEEQQRLVEEAKKEAERERVEKRRVVGILAQTRASEGALKEEVESLNNEVTHLTPLLAANDALQHTIDHLARLNAAGEQEAHELMAHNSELTGHANQNQKIRHVAMIREELAESRRKHLATLSQLSTATARITALEDELNSYRAVPASSAPAFRAAAALGTTSSVPHAAARSRVSRPQMADALGSSQAPAGLRPLPTTAAAAVPAAPAHVPAPPRLLVVPAEAAANPSAGLARSTSALPSPGPPLSSWNGAAALPADPPLLPAGLARSAGPVGVPVRTGRLDGPGGAAGPRGRRKSMSLKVEGKMSVSELF